MKDRIVAAIGNVIVMQGALEHLRANRTQRALEVLELGLDQAVITLKGLADQAEPGGRDALAQALGWIRDYRRLHPRQEGDLRSLDRNAADEVLKLQDRARKILDEIK